MDKPTFIKPDARGVDQLTPDGRRKVLLDTAEGLNRQQMAEGMGIALGRLLRMIKDAQKGPFFRTAWHKAVKTGKDRRALDREAKAAFEGPAVAPLVRQVELQLTPNERFAQAMAGRRFDDFAIPQGRVVCGRTHAWVAL